VTPLPTEPATCGAEKNNLTRPESINQLTIDLEDEEDMENAESFVGEFDRITKLPEDSNPDLIQMRRGDLVELGSNPNVPLLAVFVRFVGRLFQYCTMHGNYWHHDMRSATFIVHDFIDPSELDPILPYLPSEVNMDSLDLLNHSITIPRHVTKKILSKMAQFRDQSQAYYRKFSSVLDNAHGMVAHPTETQLLTLENITSTLTGVPVPELSPTLLFAVNSSLFRTGFGFQFELRNYGESRILIVESKETVAAVGRVQTWVRAYQEEMALVAGGLEIPKSISSHAMVVKGFAKKCKKLIAESRQLRNRTPEGYVISCVPRQDKIRIPPDGVIHSLEFSDSDRDFIRVVGLYSSSRAFVHAPTLKAIPLAVLRAIDVYENLNLNTVMAHLFLIEIGVTQPFVLPTVADREAFPRREDLTKELDSIEGRIAAGETPAVAADLKDSMSHLRKDWGNLTVFCIDSEYTVEVDDGVSIEEIPDSNGQCWLRMHIAHVSAFISRSHILGQVAESRVASIYMSDGKIGMLPTWAAATFSLAPGKPVLTYSVRLDAQGNILEADIQPGIIRNVAYVSYESLDKILDYPPPEVAENLTIRIGKNDFDWRNSMTVPSKYTSEITDAQLGLLKKIYSLCRTLRAKRPITPFTSFAHKLDCTATDLPSSSMFMSHATPTHAQYDTRDPNIQVVVYQDYIKTLLGIEVDVYRPSEIIVQEPMSITGVIAAKWAAARNIPITYYGTRPGVDNLDANTEVLRRRLLENRTGESSWNRRINTMVNRIYAMRIVDSHPIEHKLMGYSHYTKVTSPIRRYYDILATWQIDAALREQARTGTSLVSSQKENDSDTSYLAVQRPEMDLIIRRTENRSLQLFRYSTVMRKHWVYLALARAHYNREAHLPSPLKAQMTEMGNNGLFKSRLIQLENQADVLCMVGDDGNAVESGDIWEVAIVTIAHYKRKIVIRPVKRLEVGVYQDGF